MLHFLAAAERPVILAGAGVLRARCSNDLVRFAELLHVPVIASWRRGDVIPNDHPLYLGMAGLRGAGDRPRAARRRRRAARHRQPAQRAHDLRVPPAGDGPALDARRPRAAHRRGRVRRAADPRDPRRRPGVPARRQRAPQGGGPRRRAGRRARRGTTPQTGPPGRPPRPSTRATWDGPGVHPGRVIAELRRLLPDDAIVTTDAGRVRRLGRPRLPVPAAGDVPRPHVGGDGLRVTRPRSPRRSSTASGGSWRSSATAAWA